MTGDALEVFDRRSLANGDVALARSDVEAPAGEADHRIPVQVAP